MTSITDIITSTESLLAPSTESSNTSFAQPFVNNIDTDQVGVSQRPSVDYGGTTTAMLGYLVLGLVAAALLVLVALYLTRTSTSSAFFRRDVETGLVSWGRGRGLEGQAAVMISHSLPDLSRSVSQEQLLPVENKKVARQTTLPTVPQRHASFQRQLSQRLHLDSIQFSVCNLEKKDDLGLLKPELYRNELIRQASVESSGAGSDTEAVGRLRFTLKYDPAIEGLIVKVVQALDLPVKDVTGSSDPYIKVYLLPDRKKKFCTKVHRRNLNPEFNEVFVFSVTWAELRDRTLQFSVYDFDRFSRNDLIGQVVLKSVTEHCDPEQEMEYLMDILNTKHDSRDLGELMLSLCYLPTAGRLTVTVIKMRNLRAMDITGSSDPYVKVCLLCQGRRIKKKKTTVKKSTLNPVYNEALVFDIPNDNIEDVTLLVKVVDYDRIGANELLGVTVIGSQVIGPGRDHWLEMLECPRRPVTQWYPLMESVPLNLITSPTRSLPPPLTCFNST
ncbi:synaptotagmin-10-like [Penaeus japonicus]|uniref:synaptotagmin-10-like n=1 Tax=Penaeus japonicus TaxID=27405 RepID=UPI001C714D9D|nr:synaptotagmin-10-like [Penaeus japonicus]